MNPMSMYNESLRAFLKPILAFLDDESVSEVMINGPADIWIERKGRLQKTEAKFSEEGLMGAARNIAQYVGRPLSIERPRLDARLPDGSRIHVILSPVARQGTTIAIRKFSKTRLTVAALVEEKSLSEPMVQLLTALIESKMNLVISGGTGSGKTSLLNILSTLIPEGERILTIEDSAELQLRQPHVVSLETRPADVQGKGNVDMGDLLQSALRLRPDRIIVGEVRGGECFHLIQAMNTGHGGSMATTHANTPVDTLRRLESLSLMNLVELPLVAARAQVASAIQWIVCCERVLDGSRKITSIAEVLPLNDKGEYRTQDIFVFSALGQTDQGELMGYFAPTGIIPHSVYKLRSNGFSKLSDAFFDPLTYQVPPPPLFLLSEYSERQWAPSLAHRTRGELDSPHVEAERVAFRRKLQLH